MLAVFAAFSLWWLVVLKRAYLSGAVPFIWLYRQRLITRSANPVLYWGAFVANGVCAAVTVLMTVLLIGIGVAG